ncbi:hypothetical protein GCM10008994_22230 [Halorubrum ejinorense]
MPSRPRTAGTLDGIDVEAVDSVDGPRPPSTASDSPPPAGAGRPVSVALSAGVGRRDAGRRPGYHHRVRVAALAAERDLLDDRVDALAAEVASLEAEVEALERAVESKERRRKQVITDYERVVTAKSASTPASSESDAAASSRTGWDPVDAVVSRVERAVAWLRRSGD